MKRLARCTLLRSSRDPGALRCGRRRPRPSATSIRTRCAADPHIRPHCG